MKDVGIRIRVEPELHKKFSAACKRQGKTVSQTLREFMRDYVRKNPTSRQPPLFPELE